MTNAEGNAARRAEIVFVVQATTRSQLRAAFPDADDELAPAGRELCRRSSLRPGRHEVLSAPGRPCAQTVAALGWDEPRVVPKLHDPGAGEWAGREVSSLSEADLARWRAGEAPPGGESFGEVCARVADVARSLPGGRYIAVVPQAVVRAAVLTALGLPVASIWNVDAEPLAVVGVSRRPDGSLRLRLVSGVGA
ncbi:histidine phosphatase family protein [Microbacterium sp. SORGH_AS_0888]|uniref:histidine phosphatase family protein n=1 Tax=Microbacterium sp. SORGH_AS_0888 TaxID=3041791 RepID=UPI002786422A|nr:histidine phosphatase family protein [Microbacterium sp. SORGH_AS_0888]MDQ1128102.1 broad specificity phosphatase PhoE [Microbacterium sp. SORGH_AS_0888]